jgi:hypothetical protein
MESKSPLGGNIPGGLIFTSRAPVLITKTEGTARLSLNDLAENRHIFPQFSCAASPKALTRKRLAATVSRLAESRKSMVAPVESTARYKSTARYLALDPDVGPVHAPTVVG